MSTVKATGTIEDEGVIKMTTPAEKSMGSWKLTKDERIWQLCRGVTMVALAMLFMHLHGGISGLPKPPPEGPGLDALQWLGFMTELYWWFSGLGSLLRATTGWKT